MISYQSQWTAGLKAIAAKEPNVVVVVERGVVIWKLNWPDLLSIPKVRESYSYRS